MSPVITGNIDVALLTFYAFVVFFIGLVVHLNRESRREGFPLEDDFGGKLHSRALINDASPKTFKLPFGRGTRSTADYAREPIDLPVSRERFPGSPLRPTGNPLVDGIGPAAWANRAKVPDLDMEGHPRIVPLSTTDTIWIDSRDPDPRGLKVIAADGAVAGTVTDVWVDKADRLIRYLTVDTGTRSVLAPMTMAKVNRARVVIDAVTAAQFADAPAIEGPASITFYEEERVQAYFGGGYLYATPERQEPLL
jgi:photosynthetic reaction center H subunit